MPEAENVNNSNNNTENKTRTTTDNAEVKIVDKLDSNAPEVDEDAESLELEIEGYVNDVLQKAVKVISGPNSPVDESPANMSCFETTQDEPDAGMSREVKADEELGVPLLKLPEENINIVYIRGESPSNFVCHRTNMADQV